MKRTINTLAALVAAASFADTPLVWEDVPPTSVVSQVVRRYAPPADLAPATNYTDEAVQSLRDDLVTGELEVANAQYAQTSEYANEAMTAESAGNASYAENLTDHETDTRSAVQIFAQLDAASHITTNDVCNIVTNEETVGYGPWICEPAEMEGVPIWLDTSGEGPGKYWMIVWTGTQYEIGEEDSTYLSFELYSGGTNFTVRATRKRYTRNALGLARLTDIPSAISNTVTKAFVEGLGIESGISAETATNIAFAVSSSATNGLIGADYIATNNPAFVAAVTNCPVAIAAGDAEALTEWGIYGGGGTIGALLAALAAAVAALKRGKVTTISAQSTDDQYPSAKCVWDIVGDVESALAAINGTANGGSGT